MAGAERGKADVGEGRMAAKEGANEGEYAEEGQDGRGKKKYSREIVRDSIIYSEVSFAGVAQKSKFSFVSIYVNFYSDSFEGRSIAGRKDLGFIVFKF